MSWVLDGDVLKYMTTGTQNIFRQGPHQPPLFHHLTRCLISIPCFTLREVVFGDVLKPHRLHRYSACSLKVHVEVSRKNQICPHWPLQHRCHHIPNRCVGEQCQVTVGPVAASCTCFYRPAMVVIVVVVAVFVNVVAFVVFGAGRPPNGLLSPCQLQNGKNTRAWV